MLILGFVRAARLPTWNLLTAPLTGLDVELSGWGEHGKYTTIKLITKYPDMTIIQNVSSQTEA